MKIELDLNAKPTDSETLCQQLAQSLRARLSDIETELITDLSHISHFANYTGDMQIDSIEHLGEQRYLMHYSFGWQINNACADQLDEGRISEKVRFEWQPPGLVSFRILKFD
ncbi:MAG: hypothetical protein IBX48_07440 [Thiomicrospira sp.]|uniref:hypothetical protein n=1 Tax=Thiomicrospira sp. TaxID=935 RepID=UPI0019DF6757|nr:hypothetical protein [Thiomicrospira sp.]MBE0494160.1 hypothetical protein [Thiomicrospira sp.]